MSTVKTNNLQLGQSLTATNNFSWYQPSSPDGTVRLGVGNAGATTADVIKVNSSGIASTTITAANGNTVEATSGPTSTQLAGQRNKIINGAMMIDQRNAGAAVTAEGYLVDRWRVWRNESYSIQQSVDSPAGFSNSLAVTKTSTSQSLYAYLVQYIEGFNFSDMLFGTANAKTGTISFWVKSSVTGTFSAGLVNSAENRAYSATYTINAANTWEQKTIIIPGDTSGTWVGATNGKGVGVWFNFGSSGSGGTNTANAWVNGSVNPAIGGTANLGTTNGATFYITGVQLEKGATATPFENRLYGTELALCQRYFEKSYDIGTVPATITDNGCEVLRAPSSNPYQTVTYRVTKRAVPTFTTYNPTTGATGSWRDASGPANVATTVSFQGEKSAAVDVTTTTGYRIQGQWTASAEL